MALPPEGNKSLVEETSQAPEDHNVIQVASNAPVSIGDTQENTQSSKGKEHILNLNHLVPDAIGHVEIELKLLNGESTNIKLPMADYVDMEIDDATGLIRISGNADDVQAALSELQLLGGAKLMQQYVIQVKVIQAENIFSHKVVLHYNQIGDHYLIKTVNTSGTHDIEEYNIEHQPMHQDDSNDVAMIDPTGNANEAPIQGTESQRTSTNSNANQEDDSRLEGNNTNDEISVPDVTPTVNSTTTGTDTTTPPPTTEEPPVVEEVDEVIPTSSGSSGPSISFTGVPNAATFTEDAGAHAMDDFTVVGAPTITITITLSDTNAGAFNTETIGTATSTFNATTGVWTVAGDTTDVNAVLENIEFTPNANYDQDFTADLVAENAGGEVINSPIDFTAIQVADAVAIDTPIIDQSAPVGDPFSLIPPSNSFVDPDTGDTLTYSATLNGGGALPAWLSINTTTGELTGNPASGDIGTITVDITATDSQSNSVTDSFDLQVTNSLSVSASNQTKAFTEDAGALDLDDIDITSISTTASATISLSDTTAGSFNTGTVGTATSTFNATTGVWSVSGDITDINTLLTGLEFTPAADYDKNLTANVVINDGVNLPLTDVITLNAIAVDDTPTLATPVNDQITTATNAFNFDISSNFEDVDTGNVFTYAATLIGGGALPAWLSINAATGVFSGTPAIGDIANVAVTVKATDSGGTTVQDNFAIDVTAGGLIVGTVNNDDISGAGIADTIYGLDGDDTINGGAGNDIIYGEADDDIINGGNHRDSVEGGTGDDIIIGGHYTSSADQQDTLKGGDGNDWIHGGYHHDSIYGDAGDDTLSGGWHNDRIYAGDGNDWVHGGAHTDYIYGQSGDNTLISGTQRDLVYGGTGADTFLYIDASHSTSTSNYYDTIYNFTQGVDVIDLSKMGFSGIGDLTITSGGTTRITDAVSGLRIDLSGNYTLTAADFVFTSVGADTLIPDHGVAINNAYNFTFDGNTFSSIDDGNLSYTAFLSDGEALPYQLSLDATTGTFTGSFDASAIGTYSITVRADNGSGDIGYDTFILAVAENVITGTINDDTLTGGADDEAIYGIGADDSIDAGNGNNSITTLDGNDTITSGSGMDTIYAGDGDNVINTGLQADYVVTGSGNDHIVTGSDTSNSDRNDTVYAGDGDDYIHGGRYHDRLYGEGGNDTIEGGVHNDTIYGGDGDDVLTDGWHGNDYLYAGAGNDSLSGGGYNDRLYGQEGTNFLNGGTGRDSLYSGTGNDYMVFNTIADSSGTNADTIYNFTQGADKIDLINLGYTGIGDLNITAGATTTIVDPNSTFNIKLSGNYTLTAADFVFAASASDSDITNQAIVVNNLLTVTLDANHFTSIDDGNLIYTASTTGGGALPSWLTFNAATGVLSGTPASGDIGTADIIIRATNGSGDIAEDSFSVLVGQNIITGTVNADTLTGTAMDDIIIGNGHNDSITGGDGDDIVNALSGDDTINTGNGNDTVYAGDGANVIDGGLGADSITTGSGNDSIIGGSDTSNSDGNDTIRTGDGDDYIHGGRRNDYLYGEGGNDTIEGGVHDDRIYGGDGDDVLLDDWHGNDYLYAGAGNDSLSGGAYNDRLYGESGTNFLNGGTGRDSLYSGSDNDFMVYNALTESAGTNADTIYNFTQGEDRIDLSQLGFSGIGDLTLTAGATTTIVDPNSTFNIKLSGNYTLTAADFVFSASVSDVDILDQTNTVGNLFSVTLDVNHFTSIDDGNLIYSASLAGGGALPNWLSFGGGTLSGTAANGDIGTYDVVIRAVNGSGDIAEDTFSLSVGENIILGTVGADTLTGTAVGDIILGLGDSDSITGGDGNDIITALGGDDTITGDNGNDTINAGDGANVIDGGLGADSITTGSGNDSIIGGSDTSNSDGNDTIRTGDGDDYIHGGRRNDYLYGEGGNDTIEGGVHDDRIYGGDGDDVLLDDWHGNDYLYAGAGNDSLSGGAYNDRLYGESGTNFLNGGTGRDSLYGGTGSDYIVYNNLNESAGTAADTIYNFTQGADKIDLSAFGFSGVGDLTLTAGATTTIVDPNSTFNIKLSGNYTLTAADFIFAASVSDVDIIDQNTIINNLFSVTLDVNHFTSIDDGNLVYSASTTGGGALPSWLTFNAGTGVLSGTPTASGSWDIVIRAVNGTGDIAEDTFSITAAENVILGTAGVDTLTGGALADLILADADDDSVTGGDGNDIIKGNAGNDTLLGGNNNDSILGGDGNDFIDGEYGRDTLDGGAGNDTLVGGHPTAGGDVQDSILGGTGDDLIDGGRHHDTLRGGDGVDSIYGGVNNDSMYGDAGNDFLHGGTNEDRMYGGDGDDLLVGWAGRDSLYGGDGDDIFMITSTTHSQGTLRDRIYDFVQGDDKIDLSNLGITFGDLTVTVGATTIITGANNLRIDIMDNITLLASDFIFSETAVSNTLDNQITEINSSFSYNIANNTFSAIDDGNLSYYLFNSNYDKAPNWVSIDQTDGTITANPTSTGYNELTIKAINGSGQVSSDTFVLYVGDTVISGTGTDNTITGDNAKADALEGKNGHDSLSGLDGNDGLFGGNGDDTLLGGNNDDYLEGNADEDSIDGGFGRDLIYGGNGNDTLIGGSDTSNNDREDTIYGNNGDDSIHGGRYHDQLHGGAGSDTINGGVHNDTLYGDGGDDLLLDDWHGLDQLYGGAGNDTLSSGAYNDKLYGEDGNDSMDGGTGNDTLTGGDGRDTMSGGTGNDIFIFEAGDSNVGTPDLITDFGDGTDLLDFSDFGFAGIGDLTITDDGTTTNVTDGANIELDLTGVLTLGGGDFIF